MWEPQLPALSERARVIRDDHRGHGGSPAPPGPYEISSLDRTSSGCSTGSAIERASYCGLSLGGMVGMWLAANVPERIDKLVLICTSSAPAGRGARPTPRALRPSAPPGPSSRLRTPCLPGGSPRVARSHPELFASLRSMLVRTPAAGYAGCCEAIAQLDLRGGAAGDRRPDARDRGAAGSRHAARARAPDRGRHPRGAAPCRSVAGRPPREYRTARAT